MGRNNLLSLHYGAQASEYNHARQQIPSLWWKKNFKRENLVMPNFLHPESREESRLYCTNKSSTFDYMKQFCFHNK